MSPNAPTAGQLSTGKPGAAAPSVVASGLERWARDTPDNLAVCDVRRSMTFGELGSLAAALAGRLVGSSPTGQVDQPSWLPVVVDRSVEAVVALQGVIRAGRPFTPIEATLPKDRVAQLFARLGHPTEAVVADPAYSAFLPAGVRPILASGHESGGAAPVAVAPGDPGLVVFTSGSTGRPKGVVRRWSAFERSAQSEENRGAARDGLPSRHGQLRPFSFSGGLGRLLTIATGGSLHIIDPSSVDADSLLDWLDHHQIDELSLGTTLAAVLLRAANGARRLGSVTWIRTGGEALSYELVAPLRALAAPTVTIGTGFGSSESGPAMRYVVGPQDPIGEGRVPMGRPTEPWRIRLSPVDGGGSSNQLVVGDPCALYYLSEPELTAKRFIIDGEGMRWWLSGDIVVIDGDGLYHHRGRIDEMVKINGMLVGPSESEEALRLIPGIGNAAVLPHRTPNGKTRLVAHLRVDDPTLTPEAVRTQLEARLPRHLMPALLVRHDELPRNERNKLDRTALRSSQLTRWRSTAPREEMSELEWWLVDQVARLLDLGDVGPDDDVWSLGLDSLGAVELCAIVSDADLGELDPTALLECRSAAAFAKRLAEGPAVSSTTAVELNAMGSRPALFAIPGGGGTALTFRALAQSLGDEQPLVVIEPQGLHRPGEPDRTIAAHASSARSVIEHRLEPGAPCVLLGYSAGGTVAYEIAQQLHASGRPVHLVLLDAAPGRRKGGNPDPDKQPQRLAQKIRARTLREAVGAVPHGVDARLSLLRVKLIALRPGKPSKSVLRYRAFQYILGRAMADYEPARAAFPVTLLKVAGNDVDRRCRPLVADLDVHPVGGDHRSMLLPPYVAGLAAKVAALVDRVFDS